MAVGDSKYPIPKLPSTIQFENPKTYDDLFRLFNSFRELVRVIDAQGFITDAPIDGVTYGRKDGAWDPVTGGVPEAPLDGQQYGRQSGAWTAISGGGGGGFTYGLENLIDIPPTSPSSWNDEFNGTTLDPSWTIVNPTSGGATVSVTVHDGSVWMQDSAFTTAQARLLIKPIPVGTNFTVIAKLRMHGYVQYNNIGLGTYNTSTTQWVGTRLVQRAVGSSLPLPGWFYFTGPAGMGSAAEGNFTGNTESTLYFKVTQAGSVVTYYFSQDGVNWVQSFTYTGLAYDQIGIFYSDYNSAAGAQFPSTLECQWIRSY